MKRKNYARILIRTSEQVRIDTPDTQLNFNIEKLFFNGRITATTNNCNPKFADLAETFGIKSLYCNNINDINEIKKNFLEYKGPILCEFDVVDEICLPLVRPGCGLDEMLLEEEYIRNFDSKNAEPPS